MSTVTRTPEIQELVEKAGKAFLAHRESVVYLRECDERQRQAQKERNESYEAYTDAQTALAKAIEAEMIAGLSDAEIMQGAM